MSKQPFCKFADFLKACSNKQNIILINDEDEYGQVRDTREDARNDFGLNTLDEILDFISNGGLENLNFKNSTPYRKCPELIVDAYEFNTCGKLGYIAFLQNRKGEWRIKSLHLSDNSNSPFKELFDNNKDFEDLKRILGEKG